MPQVNEASWFMNCLKMEFFISMSILIVFYMKISKFYSTPLKLNNFNFSVLI